MTESQNNPGYYMEDDEITLKELILKIQEFYREVKKSWKLILLITIPLMLYMGYKAYTTKASYQAKLTFMINKNEGGGIGALGGLLGQIGFGGKGESNKDRILGLNKSRRIVEQAMFEKVTIDGENDFIANHLIHHLDTLGKWAAVKWYKKPFAKPNPLVGFRFKENFSESNDTVKKAIKAVYGIITGNEKSPGIMTNGYDEDSGIMHISTTTNHPDISIAITNATFDKLSKFYIDKSIESQKATYDIIKAKTDSIYSLLKIKEVSLANFKDKAHGIQTSKANLKRIRLERDIMKLGAMYGESVKNLELADFTLRNNTPYVQEIDRPMSPLRGVKSSLIKSLIIGAFLGMFLGIGFIVARKIYRDAMSEE